jgi:site-specific recombinase XerD
LVAAFWQYQARRGLSSATHTAYGQYLAQFVEWLGDRPIQAVRPADIELGYLVDWDPRFRDRWGRSPRPRTVRNDLVALNAFFAFLARFEHVTSNPIAQIERPRIVQGRNDRLTTLRSLGDDPSAVELVMPPPATRLAVPLPGGITATPV